MASSAVLTSATSLTPPSICPSAANTNLAYDRFDLCQNASWTEAGTLTTGPPDYKQYTISVTFDLVMWANLQVPAAGSTTSRKWTVDVKLTPTQISNTSGAALTAQADMTCTDPGCTVTADGGTPAGGDLGTLAVGTPVYASYQADDSANSATVNLNNIFQFTYLPVDYPCLSGCTPQNVAGFGGYQNNPVRCDSQGGTYGYAASGCVVSAYDAVWRVSDTAYPKMGLTAKHMAIATGRLAGYSGLPGLPGASYPLTYIGSKSAQGNANYSIACAKATPPPGTPTANTSCDEYPLRNSAQGAASGGPYSICWVPPADNTEQGNQNQNFFYDNRVLYNDNYYVDATYSGSTAGCNDTNLGGGYTTAGNITPDTTLNAMFNNYGDNANCAQWSGGDATNSVALPNGERAWFFSDTYLGSPAARLTLFDSSGIRNSIVVQSGSGLQQTITGGNTCQEKNTALSFWNRYAKTPAPAPDASSGGFYWTGDQMVVGSNVVKFYYHGDPCSGCLFTINSAAVATIPVSSLEGGGSTMTITPTEFSCGSTPSDIIWGSALLSWNGSIYVYGWDAGGAAGTKNYYLAATSAANLSNPGAWAVYDGLNSSGQPIWNTCLGAASPLQITKGSGLSVASINGSLWLIQEDTGGGLSGPIAAHPASTPWGFTDSRVLLDNPPEAYHSYPYYYLVYETRLQPGLTSANGADVVLSYNVNSTAVDTGCIGADVHDAGIYRPRFIDVPTSDFTASAASAATGSVTSSPLQAAAGISNDGSAAFAGDSGSGSATSASPFTESATGNTGLGGITDWSDSWATGCPKINAPSSLKATTHPDGTVDFSWPTEGTDVWYYGYQCNATAGTCDASAGTGYTKMWGGLWAESGSSATTPVTSGITNGNTFDWYIRSFGAGNGTGGGNSPVATAPVTIAVPSVITGLTASTGSQISGCGPGCVYLSWNKETYPSPSVYYDAYYCDTKASSCTAADFAGTSWITATNEIISGLNAGHVYKFYVVAGNTAGWSGPSTEVSIAASS
jgi:hypothetical protein